MKKFYVPRDSGDFTPFKKDLINQLEGECDIGVIIDWENRSVELVTFDIYTDEVVLRYTCKEVGDA